MSIPRGLNTPDRMQGDFRIFSSPQEIVVALSTSQHGRDVLSNCCLAESCIRSRWVIGCCWSLPPLWICRKPLDVSSVWIVCRASPRSGSLMFWICRTRISLAATGGYQNPIAGCQWQPGWRQSHCRAAYSRLVSICNCMPLELQKGNATNLQSRDGAARVWVVEFC